MASNRPARETPTSPPDAGASDLPLDHALSLLLADETENALRWGAAVLERGPWTPSALVVTARLLDQMGRRRAAIEGLNLAVQQATAEGNLPLALAAAGDLRGLGADVSASLDQIAGAFCQGSERLEEAPTAPVLPQLGEFRPLSPFLTGPALASKAAQIVESVRQTEGDEVREAASRIAPLPLFSALGKRALHDLLAAFETLTVPAGHAVIREGEEEAAAYIVARGELEVSRRSADQDGKPIVLARLAAGAFFGEMALLSQLPGAASVIATRPSILLVARREALEAVVEKHPEVAVELAAHCRRQSVANLGWASPVVVAIPPRDRAALVERFQTRLFEAGDRLVESGDTPLGLHLIVSGEIAVVAHEAGERVVLANLTAGETVGEVELVLCRNAAADAIAVRPTATLFLQRDEFFALVQDHPAILHGLYGIAVRRHGETSLALEAGSATVGDESLLGAGDRAANENENETVLGPVPGDLAALVENPAPRAEMDAANPAPITPLGRGTFGLPRPASTPPGPLRPPPAPSSSRPGARTTLPPPPMHVSASSAPSSYRRSVPPPLPPPPRTGTTWSGVGGMSSVAPVTAGGPTSGKAAPDPSSALQWIAVLTIAAGVAIFAAIRGLQEEGPAAATTARDAPAAAVAVPSRPEPASTAVPSERSEPAARQPPAPAAPKPKIHVAIAVKAPTVVTVEPVPAPRAASARVVDAGAALPSAKPAVADQAPIVGEFGGRE